MVRPRESGGANGSLQSDFRNDRARFAANESRKIVPAERSESCGPARRPRTARWKNNLRICGPLKTRDDTKSQAAGRFVLAFLGVFSGHVLFSDEAAKDNRRRCRN